MRTKALLALAALAIAIPASAQVYSANVVGYVNYTLQGNYQYNQICNPLKAANNNITALFPNSNDGDYILRWDVAAFDFGTTVSTFGGGTWTEPFELNPGEGVFYICVGETPLTVTYVGEVIQGNFTNNLVGAYSYNSIGSSAPLGGSFTNALGGLTPNDGDYVMKWDVPAFDFGTTVPTYGGGAWSDTFDIAVGEGFTYVNTGSDIQWVRNFTVPTP